MMHRLVQHAKAESAQHPPPHTSIIPHHTRTPASSPTTLAHPHPTHPLHPPEPTPHPLQLLRIEEQGAYAGLVNGSPEADPSQSKVLGEGDTDPDELDDVEGGQEGEERAGSHAQASTSGPGATLTARCTGCCCMHACHAGPVGRPWPTRCCCAGMEVLRVFPIHDADMVASPGADAMR
jgi:hypothetical protein